MMIVGRPRAAVLLVEGSRRAREMNVLQALTGARALAKMTDDVSIVVSEAGTVDMSLDELQDFLRASRPQGATPIVLVSETPRGDVEVSLLSQSFASRVRVPDAAGRDAFERALAMLLQHRVGAQRRREQEVTRPAMAVSSSHCAA